MSLRISFSRKFCQSFNNLPFNTRGNLCCPPSFPEDRIKSIKFLSGKHFYKNIFQCTFSFNSIIIIQLVSDFHPVFSSTMSGSDTDHQWQYTIDGQRIVHAGTPATVNSGMEIFSSSLTN